MMITRSVISSCALATYAALVFIMPFPHVASAQPAAPAVVVDEVEIGAAAAPVGFKGKVEAIEAVDIAARASGFLKEVLFDEGQAVKAGDMLFEIEPDQLQAALASADAQLVRATASRDAAQRTLSRTRALRERNTSSQAALDEAQAAFDIASADVQNAEALRNSARLNLSHTKVYTPISGTTGRALATRGNLVGPNSGPLARVVQLDPIRIVFFVPDRLLLGIRQSQAQGQEIDPDALKLTLSLANGTEYGERGAIQFIDNGVDPQTGTIAIRALFPNPDHILMPGQFVTLNLLDEATGDLPLIPMSSVSQDREGKFVYILNADDTVSRRDVQTGVRIDNKWSVTEGLEGGEIIVIEGLQRIANGQTVVPRQSGAAE
jgi:membrane fusion protein (multidrug efflux system)